MGREATLQMLFSLSKEGWELESEDQGLRGREEMLEKLGGCGRGESPGGEQTLCIGLAPHCD